MQQNVFLDLVLAGFSGSLVVMVREGSQAQCGRRQLLVSELPGAARPSIPQHLFVVGMLHDVPASSLGLQLEPSTCTGAITFPGLIQLSNSLWFRTQSTNISPSSCHKTPRRVVNVALRSIPQVQN